MYSRRLRYFAGRDIGTGTPFQAAAVPVGDGTRGDGVEDPIDSDAGQDMVPKSAVQEQKAGDGRRRRRHDAGWSQQKATPETVSGDQTPLRGAGRRQQ